MTILYIVWQDPEERTWRPVGQLTFADGVYKFRYTIGALESKRFIPFGRMKDLKNEYKSYSLFPLFSNRMLQKNRPEYQEYINWLNLGGNVDDPLLILSRTGGQRKTDSMHVYQLPTKSDDGTYQNNFFVHGLRYLPENSIETVHHLKYSDRVYLMLDIQNKFHPSAVAIRTEDPKCIIGYFPRYLSDDIRELVAHCDPIDMEITVQKINLDAPIQMRLLCSVRSKWPDSFKPCSSREFLPA